MSWKRSNGYRKNFTALTGSKMENLKTDILRNEYPKNICDTAVEPCQTTRVRRSINALENRNFEYVEKF